MSAARTGWIVKSAVEPVWSGPGIGDPDDLSLGHACVDSESEAHVFDNEADAYAESLTYKCGAIVLPVGGSKSLSDAIEAAKAVEPVHTELDPEADMSEIRVEVVYAWRQILGGYYDRHGLIVFTTKAARIYTDPLGKHSRRRAKAAALAAKPSGPCVLVAVRRRVRG